MVEKILDCDANCKCERTLTLNFSCKPRPFQVQFGVVFIHTLQVQFYPSCKYPKSIAALLTLNAALFFYMFSSFYYNAYVLRPRAKVANQVAKEKLANGVANGVVHANGISNGHVDQSRKEQ